MKQSNQYSESPRFSIFQISFAIVLSIVSIFIVVTILSEILFGTNFGGVGSRASTSAHNIMERFDNFITNMISDAADGFIVVEKVYMLSDSDQVAPEPLQSHFGKTSEPASLQWLLDKAAYRMDGQDILFSTDTSIYEDSEVNYYLDDTIFAVSWKEVKSNVVYTFSEVKIEHPSQFRRFLADGEYGSAKQYLTSQMASSVNAVVASAGDFYKYRSAGHVVYNGEVKRANGFKLDTCFIDNKGDLIFSKAGELSTEEEIKQFVADNEIRFSICFGPILINNGERFTAWNYPVGEINGNFARSAICQLGPLHYLLVTVNSEGKYRSFPTLKSFGDVLEEMGIEKAYTLDGGQTATIVMNDQVFNNVSYGAERYISDIIYFATALPEK